MKKYLYPLCLIKFLLVFCSFSASGQVFLFEDFEDGINQDCFCPINFSCTNDARRAVNNFHPLYTPLAITCSLSGSAYTTSHGSYSGECALFYYAGADKLASDPIEILESGTITFSVWYAGPQGNEIPVQQFGEKAYFTFGLDGQRVGPKYFPKDDDWTEVCFQMEVLAGFHTFEIFSGENAQYAIWFDDFQISKPEIIEFYLGSDTSICDVDSFILTIPGDIDDIEWSDGSMDSFLVVYESGTYSLTVGDGCNQNVEEIEIEFISFDSLNIPSDTSICSGDEIIINLDIPEDVTIEWQDGSMEEIYSVTMEGLYILERINYCGSVFDSFYVDISDDFEFHLGADTGLCANEELIIDLSYLDGMTFVWSDSSDGTTFIIDSSGNYSVSVSNGCYEHSDDINVEFGESTDFNFGPDTQICSGDVLEFACPEDASCTWSDLSQDEIFMISDSGVHFVEITDSCGIYYDTIVVLYILDTFSTLLNDTFLCEGDNIVINLELPDVVDAEWQDGSTEESYTITDEGLYIVTLMTPCLTSIDSFYVTVVNDFSLALGSDSVLCSGSNLEIDLSNIEDVNYDWNDGSEDAVLIIDSSGMYSVTVSNACFEYSDEIFVDFIDTNNFSFGPDTQICEDSFLEYHCPEGAVCTWSDQSQSMIFEITESGLYFVEIEDLCAVQYDSIYVEVLEFSNFDFGPDTVICEGSSLEYHCPEGAVCTWSDQSQSTTFEISESGLYFVEVAHLCGVINDSLYVEVTESTNFDFGPDTLICEGDILLFDCPVGAECTWSDGSQDSSFELPDSGSYYVDIIDPCRSYSDTIRVDIDESVSVINDSILLCPGDSFFLSQISTDFELQWLDTYQEYIVPLSTGCFEYMVVNQCTAVVQCVFIQIEKELDINLGVNEVLCQGDSKAIEILDLENYSWSTGASSSNITIEESGIYWLTSYNSCFMDSDTIKIDFKTCDDCSIYIPNVFSPNGNAENDVFQCLTQCLVESSELLIFNRWGEKVFASQDINHGWDGSFKGELCATGVYLYQFKYRVNGEDFLLAGDITLVY